jgi:hypothetical protein
MSDSAEERPSKPIVAQQRLQSAFLIRCWRDGQVQRFMLEDVVTRKRQHFDNFEQLLVQLRELVSAETL